MVQLLQVVVRQPLADVVPDSQAAAAGLEHGIDRPQEPLVLDLPGQRPDKALDRDAGVIVFDVQLGGVLRALRVIPQGAADVLLDALPAPAGDGGAGPVIHTAHQHGLHDGHQEPVHHAVRPERDDLDDAPLLAAVVVDFPLFRRGGDKALGHDHIIGLVHIFIQVFEHPAHLPALALPARGLQDDAANKAFVRHLLIEESNSLGHFPMLLVCLQGLSSRGLLNPVLPAIFSPSGAEKPAQ